MSLINTGVITHDSTGDTTLDKDRKTMIDEIDDAFHAAQVTFAIFAAAVEDAPASPVATVTITLATGVVVVFNILDDQPTFDGKFAQLEGQFYNVKTKGRPAFWTTV